MKRLGETQEIKRIKDRAMKRENLIDRDELLRLAWQQGHPYPPMHSSVNLAGFLKRRGIGVFK